MFHEQIQRQFPFWQRKGSIVQRFNRCGLSNIRGKDLYPSVEEKAAMLRYLVTKNHSYRYNYLFNYLYISSFNIVR